MSLWPFVTVLASLVLILLFRRIDKRTISFHKFKRYADKLSADFDRYLQHKKQELAGSVHDLEDALRGAAQFLVKLETAESSLRTNLLNLGGEKNELLAVKNELAKLTTLKEKTSAEVAAIERHLPPLKKLGKRVQSIGMRVAENEKALKNVQSAIPEIGGRVHERTEAAIEEMRGVILEESKGALVPVVDEYRQNLDLLRNAHGEEMERMKKFSAGVAEMTERKIAELSGAITACAKRISDMEGRDVRLMGERIAELDSLLGGTRAKIEAVQGEMLGEFQRRVDAGFKGYAQTLDAAKEGFRQEMFAKIEERAKDLSAYVAGLEGRVQSLVGDFEKETGTQRESLDLQMKAQQFEAEGLRNRLLAEISEEAQKNLLLLRPIVSEVNEKLQLSKKEFSLLTDAMKAEFDAQIKGVGDRIQAFRKEVEGQKDAIFGELEKRLEGAGKRLNEMDQKVDEKVRQVSENVSADFMGKLNEYEQSVSGLEGRIGDLKIIAKTGQKMIEERIESVFKNYQPDIEEKIQSIRRSTEESFARERDKILQRMSGIVETSEIELKKREASLQSFLGEAERKIRESRDALEKEQETILKNVETLRGEARGELVRELENLKDIFREEKERVLGRYAKDLTGVSERLEGLANRAESVRSTVEERSEALNRRLESFRVQMEEKISGLNGAVDDVRSVIGERVETAVRGVEGSVKAAETSYLRTGDELAGKLRKELERIESEIGRTRETVGGLRDAMMKETRDHLTQFRDAFEGSFEEHKDAFRDKEEELKSLVDSTVEGIRAEVSKSEKSAGEALKSFEEKAGSVQRKIEKRVQEIEKRISDFERDSQIIKKAVQFKDEVKEEIEKLSDYIFQIKEDKKDILELRKVIDALKRDEGDIAAKVRSLKSEKKLVFDIAKNAENAVGLITVVEEKIKLIEGQKDGLAKMETELKQIGERFDTLESKAGHLASKEEDIEVSVETITKTKEFIVGLEKRTEILKESFSEIKGNEEDVKRRIAIIEEKTLSLKQNEKLMDEVLTRFKSMDALVLDIETRTKQLQSAREWLANTESRLTNISGNAERLVGELKSLEAKQEALGAPYGADLAGDGKTFARAKGGAVSRESESKVKTVLTLFDQKWTIPEICKVTKMSRGEVELILELNNR